MQWGFDIQIQPDDTLQFTLEDSERLRSTRCKKSLNRHGVKNTMLARPAETLALKKNDGELLFYFLFSDMETECYPCIPMHSASNQVWNFIHR